MLQIWFSLISHFVRRISPISLLFHRKMRLPANNSLGAVFGRNEEESRSTIQKHVELKSWQHLRSLALSTQLLLLPRLFICIFLFICLYLSICLSFCAPVCFSVYLSLCLSIYLALFLSPFFLYALPQFLFNSLCQSFFSPPPPSCISHYTLVI